MDNVSKIKKHSRNFYLLLSGFLAIIPFYYLLYWILINQLPDTLISVNINAPGLSPNHLPVTLQVLGFAFSLLPMSALGYGLINIRQLFSYYRQGVIFSFEHVILFKKTAKGLVLWVLASIVYESAKSVIFSLGNPPGSRVIGVSFGSPELTTLVIGGVVFFIAWVMDEGRVLNEENELTV
ncbi:DUF2975 domain-containing protein [Desulfoluna sp.]|uniref:DUF2975 domain-containing protein n=1 Tax=Desulfoluna sp. TaxID=2045199 RepID=UPI0026019D9B|nr:DUF2975 domain-containing protein [Desulfoluna sp.]